MATDSPPKAVRLAAALFVLMVQSAPLSGQCTPPDDRIANLRREMVAQTIGGTGSAVFLARLSLVWVPEDSVTILGDSAQCRRVTSAIVRDQGVDLDLRSFTLLRAGPRLLAYPVTSQIETTPSLFVFDTNLTVLFRGHVTWATPRRRPPTESRCMGSEEDLSQFYLGVISKLMREPPREIELAQRGIDRIPVDSVRHVGDAATCQRAMAAIKEHVRGRSEEVVFTLFRVGRFHWAESEWPRAGEWTLTFILDETAGRVLGQY